MENAFFCNTGVVTRVTQSRERLLKDCVQQWISTVKLRLDVFTYSFNKQYSTVHTSKVTSIKKFNKRLDG